MARRAVFEDFEPDFGQPVIDEVNRLRKLYCAELMKKKEDKEAARRRAFNQMMYDLENKKELKLPKIKFTKLVWPEQEEH